MSSANSFGSVPALIRGDSSSIGSSDGFSIGSRAPLWSTKSPASAFRSGVARVRRYLPLSRESRTLEPSIIYASEKLPAYAPPPEAPLSEAEIAVRLEWLNMIVCGPKRHRPPIPAWDSTESLVETEFFTPLLGDDAAQGVVARSEPEIPTILITSSDPLPDASSPWFPRYQPHTRCDASAHLFPDYGACVPQSAPPQPDPDPVSLPSQSHRRKRRAFAFTSRTPPSSAASPRARDPPSHGIFATLKSLTRSACRPLRSMKRHARAQTLRLFAYLLAYIILPVIFAWFRLGSLPQRTRLAFRRWKSRG